MKKIQTLPTLYSLSSKGKVKQWTVSVEEQDGSFYLCSAHGYLDQTITSDYSSAIVGKNIGKKNETSPREQAKLEAKSKWQSKIDKNYTEAIPTSVESFTKLRPMLAQKYSERKHYIKFPAYVQPKLDGVRSLATFKNDAYEFTSRGDKVYSTVNHLSDSLKQLKYTPALVFDGEIYIHGKSLQEINSAVKKLREETAQLEFWIFDLAIPKLTFKERLKIIESMCLTRATGIKALPTYEVNSEEEILEYHKVFSQEFEGTMVRNADGLYVFDYRSNDLQKHKDFVDDEFEIVGGKEGSGNDEGTVIFRCKTKLGKEFDVRPRGSREQRREWYKELPKLITKKLTVRYQQLSDDGIPIFPVGITIRDYE
jgi:DNA ligase-1